MPTLEFIAQIAELKAENKELKEDLSQLKGFCHEHMEATKNHGDSRSSIEDSFKKGCYSSYMNVVNFIERNT